MKYKHREAGTIAEPTDELAEQHFARSPDWAPVKDKPRKPTAPEAQPPATDEGAE